MKYSVVLKGDLPPDLALRIAKAHAEAVARGGSTSLKTN